MNETSAPKSAKKLNLVRPLLILLIIVLAVALALPRSQPGVCALNPTPVDSEQRHEEAWATFNETYALENQYNSTSDFPAVRKPTVQKQALDLAKSILLFTDSELKLGYRILKYHKALVCYYIAAKLAASDSSKATLAKKAVENAESALTLITKTRIRSAEKDQCGKEVAAWVRRKNYHARTLHVLASAQCILENLSNDATPNDVRQTMTYLKNVAPNYDITYNLKQTPCIRALFANEPNQRNSDEQD